MDRVGVIYMVSNYTVHNAYRVYESNFSGGTTKAGYADFVARAVRAYFSVKPENRSAISTHLP